MTGSSIAWQDRLARLAMALLLGATAYGVVVGAVIAMYYDMVSGMGALEDRLAPPQAILYLLAVLISVVHLPPALSDIQHRRWRQALVRMAVGLGPLIVFLGTEGLIAHLLWWLPISETDRFHLLHHSLVAGIPLTLGYWLLWRRLWRPADFETAGVPSRRAWLVSGLGMVGIAMGVGIVAGLVSPAACSVITVIGLLAVTIAWRAAGRPAAPSANTISLLTQSPKRIAVITVGMTHSGKTTFAHHLQTRLPNSVVVDQDTHAAFLNTHYRSLVPVTGPNHLKFAVSRAIVDHAIDRTTAHLIFCNANRSGAARTRLLDRLARAGFTTVLVDFRIAEDLLRQRVAASERSTDVLRASTSFAEVLARQQRASGDPDTTVPAVGDADHLFRVDRSEAVPDVIQAILEIDHGPH